MKLFNSKTKTLFKPILGIMMFYPIIITKESGYNIIAKQKNRCIEKTNIQFLFLSTNHLHRYYQIKTKYIIFILMKMKDPTKCK